MGVRSKIDRLLSDSEVAELNAKIKANGFGGYRELEEELREMGYEISKSALHTHGQKLEAQVRKIRAAAEQADHIRKFFPDDDGSMTDAILRTFQAGLFEYMQDFALESNSIDPMKLAKAIKDISHASISQKRLMSDMRKEALGSAQAAVDRGDWEQEALDEAKRQFGW